MSAKNPTNRSHVMDAWHDRIRNSTNIHADRVVWEVLGRESLSVQKSVGIWMADQIRNGARAAIAHQPTTQAEGPGDHTHRMDAATRWVSTLTAFASEMNAWSVVEACIRRWAKNSRVLIAWRDTRNQNASDRLVWIAHAVGLRRVILQVSQALGEWSVCFEKTNGGAPDRDRGSLTHARALLRVHAATARLIDPWIKAGDLDVGTAALVPARLLSEVEHAVLAQAPASSGPCPIPRGRRTL